MKKLIYLTLLSVFIISCDQEKSSIATNDNIVEFNANELLTQYNNELTEKWGVAVPELKKGIHSVGELQFEMKRKESDGRPYASFLFSGDFGWDGEGIQFRKFDFGLTEKLEFPEKIDNAEILFLGNQLIIQNPKDGSYLNLYVDNGKVNKTAHMNSIEGFMLRTVEGTGIDSLRSGTCDCDCKQCPLGHPNCPATVSCSCSCAGVCSCSTECSGNNYAECTCNCGGGEQ
jgi:hypothetical protein